MPPDRRLGFPLSVPAPSSLPLSATPLLVEASLGGVAQLERDALGREGDYIDYGPGVAHDGFGLVLQAQAYAEDGAYGACPLVADIGLHFQAHSLFAFPDPFFFKSKAHF